MLFGMVRTKFQAVLLGTVGIGFQDLFLTIQTMGVTLSGLGLKSSGVKEVAEATGTGDDERIARTILTLRRMSLLTGVLGALLIVSLSKPIGHLAFGSDQYTFQIASLGLAVMFASISAGQLAAIQGLRRIGDIAKINILTACVGTVTAITLFWFFRLDGIVPSLVALTMINLSGSYWYARRIPRPKHPMSWAESFRSAKGLIGLGVAFMWTAVLAVLVNFTIKAFLRSEVGVDAVGIYSAAFSLSGMFIGFVLAAMGTEFFPSLTAVSNDRGKMKALVNQQTEIGLLLAVPGLLATLALAPWIIQIFYTAKFAQSADLLQWLVLGCLGQVISWPMGFIIIVKGSGRFFALTSSVTSFVHLSLVLVGTKFFGLEGTAFAFCLLNMFHILWTMYLGHRLIDFRWSASVIRLLTVLLPIAALTMLQSRYLPLIPSTVIGLLASFITGLFCLRGLCGRLGSSHRIVKLLKKIPFSHYLIID